MVVLIVEFIGLFVNYCENVYFPRVGSIRPHFIMYAVHNTKRNDGFLIQPQTHDTNAFSPKRGNPLYFHAKPTDRLVVFPRIFFGKKFVKQERCAVNQVNDAVDITDSIFIVFEEAVQVPFGMFM